MVLTRPRPDALAWLALSAVVLVLDQWTKHWVLTSLPEYQAIPVIEGFWNWYRTYNTGAAFSFLADAGGWQHWFFVGLAVVICGVLVAWLRRTPRADYWPAFNIADSAIVAGAIGIALFGLVGPRKTP